MKQRAIPLSKREAIARDRAWIGVFCYGIWGIAAIDACAARRSTPAKGDNAVRLRGLFN